jgi:hypothetical protein
MLKALFALFAAALALASLGFSFYGLYLAFSASVVLGVLALFIEPAPLVFGVLMFFGHINVAHRIVEYFSR